MKRIGLALAAMAMLALAATPMAAQAQAKAPDRTINKDQRAQGIKEAPAVVQSAGVPCTVTDAYFLGKSGQKDAAGKDYQASIYETACKEGMGYVVISAPSGAKAKAYDCLATASNPSLACRLPANADPKQNLAPLLSAAGHPCTLKDARYVGTGPTGDTYYEAACQEGEGYILQTSATGAPKATPCLQMQGGPSACTLTPKAQSVASFSALVRQSGKTCQVSDVRYVGSSTATGETFYEIACGSQPGFMLQTDAKGAFKLAISCGNASGIGGGCQMTNAAAAATQEASTYTGLAKAGGFNCNVTKYRFIGIRPTPKAEIVELACSNRPDGVVAVFPDQQGAKPEFVDCVRSGEFGATGTCQLTSLTPIYAKYSAALAARGRSSCKVSGARWIGRSPEHTDYIETACADGGPGWVIELTPTDQVKTLLNCGQAKASGLTCQLPTNVK